MKIPILGLTLCLCACLCFAACNSNHQENSIHQDRNTAADGSILYTDENGNTHHVTFDDGSETAAAIVFYSKHTVVTVSGGTGAERDNCPFVIVGIKDFGTALTGKFVLYSAIRQRNDGNKAVRRLFHAV